MAEADIIAVQNEALAAMGGKASIATLLETSVEAKEVRRHYGPLVDQLLSSALWNFARRAQRPLIWKAAYGVEGVTTESPTWDNTWPEPPWSYSYRFAPAYLRVRYIVEHDDATAQSAPLNFHDALYTINPPHEFVVSGDVDPDSTPTPNAPIRTLLCNLHRPVVIYTARLDDPVAWDPLFHQTFVYMLAARIALALGGDKELIKLNTQLGIASLQQAQVINANTGINMYQSIPDWIIARGVPDASKMP